MNVDAYMVEGGEYRDTFIVHADELSDIRTQPFGGKGGPGQIGGIPYREAMWEGERVTVLSALSLWRSIDHGLRTADGTALEIIGEVCETIVAPVLVWMVHAVGIDPFRDGPFRQEHPSTDYLAAMCAERELPAWDGSGWWDELVEAEQEPIYGQGCEQDMCEDVWTACGGVVETSADAGMTWLYVTVEDYRS